MKPNLMLFIVIIGVLQIVNCEGEIKEEKDVKSLGRQIVEEGRTFVHHAIKRMAIIMPLIFFKLGISFTLLLLVTMVSINNGFIGFMLLVVGLSTVLAKMQEARTPSIQQIPIAYPSPSYGQFWDRSDSGNIKPKKSYTHSSYIDRTDTDTAQTYIPASYPYTSVIYT